MDDHWYTTYQIDAPIVICNAQQMECSAMAVGLVSVMALMGMSVWLTVIVADALTDAPTESGSTAAGTTVEV